MSAARLIGAPVANASGEQLGEIEDVIIAGNNVSHVVISVGGLLDIGDKLVTVPYEEVTLGDGGLVLYPATRAALEAAPEFHYRAGADSTVRATGSANARQDYEREVEHQLAEWNQKLERYLEDATREGQEATIEGRGKLERAWSEVEVQWQALKNTSGHAWRDVKTAFERAWKDFREAWGEATS